MIVVLLWRPEWWLDITLPLDFCAPVSRVCLVCQGSACLGWGMLRHIACKMTQAPHVSTVALPLPVKTVIVSQAAGICQVFAPSRDRIIVEAHAITSGCSSSTPSSQWS